jgi:arsenate reductase
MLRVDIRMSEYGAPTPPVFNVLFLCTGNSARSLMAEALLRHRGRDRFRAFSAGSQPTGIVHPLAIATLLRHRLPADGLRSKSWDEFAATDAPVLHFVFTVCDNAAREVCPTWPGHPMTAHWGVEDPAAVVGPDDVRVRAFSKAFRELDARISLFVSLRVEQLDRLILQRQIDRIGRSEYTESLST